MNHRLRHGQSGLSLIELMISITLGLIILTALIAVFGQNSRSFRQNDSVAEMQDSARFAMESLSRDLSMAGFNGGVFNAADIYPNASQPSTSATRSPFQANTDCGPIDATTKIPWFLNILNRVEFENNDATAEKFSCLGQALTPVQANTDRVAIRRAAGMASADMPITVTSPTLNSFTYYLQTNGTAGTLIYTPSLGSGGAGKVLTFDVDAVPTASPMSFFKWVPRVYFVRTFAHVSGDGIPALCRMELQHVAAPSMAVECLADGVENLQIQWGVDLNADGVPDQYVNKLNPTDPNATNSPANVITARIWLLVRALKVEPGYIDTKTYTLGDVTILPPNDGTRRRVYTTTVQLRNPSGVVP